MLILSINVNGPDFFKTKELFFVLFVGTSLKYGNYKNLWELFIMISAMLISACLNLIIPGSNLTFNGIISNTLGLFYLILLVFNNDMYKDVIIKMYLISATCVAILISSIWIICSSNPLLKDTLIAFFDSKKNDKVAFIMMIRNRKIFKWWVLGVYYGTAPCMIPALGYWLMDRLEHKNKKNFLMIILLTISLMMTGARANIMAAGLLVFAYFAFYLIRKRYYNLAMFMMFLVLMIGVVVAYLFLSDKGEASLKAKNLHKLSYKGLFDSDIIRTFFYGWGAGSSFYSRAYNEWTSLTELTLYETIRRYGFVSTFFIFVFIWFKPLMIIINSKKGLICFFPMLILLAYVFVACTNPFLLGSIGFCALLFFNTQFLRWKDE